MKLAIGKIVNNSLPSQDEYSVLIDGVEWGLYNSNEVVNAGLEAGESVVAQYEPQDQFARFVPLDKLEVAK